MLIYGIAIAEKLKNRYFVNSMNTISLHSLSSLRSFLCSVMSAKGLLYVMLNSFQHLKSTRYETLNQVQGDKGRTLIVCVITQETQ